MRDRELLLSHVPTQSLRGFEIGALMSPFLPKVDHDITLVDRMSTKDLHTKFAAEPSVAVDDIAEVDIAVEGGNRIMTLKST